MSIVKQAIQKMRSSNKRRRDSDGTMEKPTAKMAKQQLLEDDWQAPRKVHKSSRVLHQFYQNIELMIKSANGTLYKALEVGTKRPVCIKQIDKSRTKSLKSLNGVLIPSEIFYHFRAYEASPRYVIEPIVWLEFPTYYTIVMERPLGSEDLFEVSRNRGAIDERTALALLTQAVRCARDLHHAGICHRDIKDENILVDMSALKIKLIDFGSATDVKPDSYTMSRGTPEYWAPEFYLEGRQRAEELTIWSLGAVFYIMVTGEWNFAPPAYTPNPDKEKKLSMTSRQLLRAMLCANPNQRCRFDQLQLRNC